MVTKVYLNYPLKRVPLNGLVLFNGIFYRRRTCSPGRIYLRCAEGSYVDLSVPCSAIVQYYKTS